MHVTNRPVAHKLKAFFLGWGGVVCLTLATLAWYERGRQPYLRFHQQLCQQLQTLEQERTAALRQRTALQQQIASQSDGAWIELILMRELGLVPEGQKKVYFQP